MKPAVPAVALFCLFGGRIVAAQEPVPEAASTETTESAPPGSEPSAKTGATIGRGPLLGDEEAGLTAGGYLTGLGRRLVALVKCPVLSWAP